MMGGGGGGEGGGGGGGRGGGGGGGRGGEGKARKSFLPKGRVARFAKSGKLNNVLKKSPHNVNKTHHFFGSASHFTFFLFLDFL